MSILFIGGPYHGRKLMPIEILKHATLLTVQTFRGARKFAYFPPVESWGGDEMNPAREGRSNCYHPYEMVNTVEGPQYQYDLGGKRYLEALADSSTNA